MNAEDGHAPPTLRQYLAQCEVEYLRALLVKHDYNISAAAREANLNRTSFYRKLRLRRLYNAQRPGNAAWQALQ